VSKILNERERLRKLRLEGKADESTKLKEYVLKTIANSFYGVQGWTGFRMYDRECAEFVTRKGRELIQYLINCVKDLGFDVLYSDSVRGDMRVFVKDKGYVKIEDLFKDVSYSILDKEYYFPQEDIYVLSMSKDGKVEFKKVKYVMRHYIDDEIREVVLDEKKKIYLTKEHSIMKYINKRERRKGSGVYEVVKPDNLLGENVIEARTINKFGIRRVKEVNKVRYKGYVYDIEVKDNHNFFVENILVHNTDSLFIKPIDSDRFGKELEKYFNSKLKEWADEHNAEIPPKLKFEKLFRRILFKKKIGSKGSAKKRYAGWLIWEDGQETDTIKTVGMETKRSDVAEITKELMHKVFKLLLKEGDIEKMSNIVKEAYWNLDKYPLSKIAIPKGMKKKRDEYKTNSAWIRGTENAEKLLGLAFSYEEKPRLIYLKQPVNVICIKEDMDKLPENFVVDWHKMRDRVIKQKFVSIFDSIGLSWDQLIEGQTVLERWFE